ncbi:MAG: hypothetical protein J6T15_05075 [Bacilli bacterium]|nr:hypothetical protein [Bacilli bacterium]
MIPRVKVSVSEDTTRYFTTNVDFVPVVIMKTMSGNIGTREIVRSEAEFIQKFGKGNELTPSAYALQTYLRTYSYAYVTRVAGSGAKYGTATMSVTEAGEGTEPDVEYDLLSFKTTYKTQGFNGLELKLINDTTAGKLYLTTTINSTVITSVKQNYSAGATAKDLSEALDVICSSINAMNLGIGVTNLFVEKLVTDPVPTIGEVRTNIDEGDSGLANITNNDVLSAISLYDTSDIQVDTMSIPEFSSADIVTAAVKVAEERGFMLLASTGSRDYSTCITDVQNYPKSNSLAIYFPNVLYSGFETPIPACVAVLTGYARNDSINKWLSPAGTQRGLLPLVNGLDLTTPLTEENMSDLYDNIIPVNSIKYVPNNGYAIWGQKTTDTTAIYMDRINIARLVKFVYREVYNLSSDFLFEPINEATFTAWKLRVEALLSKIRTNQGILDYTYKMDDENNTEATIAENRLIGQIRIKPTEVAEFIDIDFVLTSEV